MKKRNALRISAFILSLCAIPLAAQQLGKSPAWVRSGIGTNRVLDIIYSPDGSRFANACDYGLVQVRDARTRTVLLEVRLPELVNAEHVALSARYAAIADRRGTLWVFDVDGHGLFAKNEAAFADSGSLTSLEFRPDGKRLLAALRVANGTSLVEFDLSAGENAIRSPDGGRLPSTPLLLPPGNGYARYDSKGARIIVRTSDSWVLLDSGTYKRVASYVAAAIKSYDETDSVSPDGRLAAGKDRMGESSGTVIASIDGKTRLCAIEGSGPVCFSSDGRLALAAGPDVFEFGLWDTTTGKQIWKGSYLEKTGVRIALSPNGETAVVSDRAGGYGVLRVYDARTGKVIDENCGPVGNTAHVSVSPDGSALVASGDRGPWFALSPLDGKTLACFSGTALDARVICASPEGAVAIKGEDILFVDRDGTIVKRVPCKPLATGDGKRKLGTVSVSADRSTILAVVSDKSSASAFVIDSQSGKVTKKFDGLQKFSSILLSEDGTRVAIGFLDGVVKVYSITRDSPLRSLKPFSVPVTQLAFSADGNVIACGSREGNPDVVAYDLSTGKKLCEVDGFSSVLALGLNGDGSTLAAGLVGGGKASLRLVRTSDGATISERPAEVALNALRFAPDGSFLACGESDRVWVLPILP